MTRELIDALLKRLALVLLVLWALWATWNLAILTNANQQLQAAYAQLQQQAQTAVNQLQAENQQLKLSAGSGHRNGTQDSTQRRN